jgi:hypothetical protein
VHIFHAHRTAGRLLSGAYNLEATFEQAVATVEEQVATVAQLVATLEQQVATVE